MTHPEYADPTPEMLESRLPMSYPLPNADPPTTPGPERSMNIVIHETIRCSQCGSEHWETFQRAGYVRGTRCLSCKHERLDEPPAYLRPSIGGTVHTSAPRTRVTCE